MGRKKARRQAKEAGSESPSQTDRKAAAPEARAASKLEAKRLVIRFLAVFSGIMVAFYAVWFLPIVREGFFQHFLGWNAQAGAAVIRLFGEEAVARGQVVASPRFSLEVGRGCDAIQPTMLFLAAMIALPAPLRAKIQGGIAGTAILLALNLVRIVTLFYVGLHRPRLFHLMHVDVWQSVFIFIAMLLWMIWALWALRPPAREAAQGGEADAAS